MISVSQMGATITKCHILHDLNKVHLFLRVLEAEKSKAKVMADSVSGEGLFWLMVAAILPCAHVAFSLCVPGVWMRRENSLSFSSYRALIPP